MSKVIITNKEDLNPIHKCENNKYEYLKYIPKNEEINNQCSVLFYDIPPQKSNYPYHYHGANIEVFYITSGHGELRTEDGIRTINPGDMIICPPGKGSEHKLTNTSDSEVLSYIEFDTVNHPEVIKYPDSNKVGIIDMNNENTFFKEEYKAKYYDGE